MQFAFHYPSVFRDCTLVMMWAPYPPRASFSWVHGIWLSRLYERRPTDDRSCDVSPRSRGKNQNSLRLQDIVSYFTVLMVTIQ